MFTWIEDLKETDEVVYKNHKYKVTALKIHGNYRIELLEDNIQVILDNTSNDCFINQINKEEPRSLQVLNWATAKIEKHYGECDLCKEERLVFDIDEKGKKVKEFLGLNKICLRCKREINEKIRAKYIEKEEKKRDKIRESLRKNPPEIVGGFKDRIEAYKFLKEMGESDVEKIDKDFILAKAILKTNNGEYYPVFSYIDISSGGELWDSYFIAKNYENELIGQDFALAFTNKNADEMFPYEYETLAFVDEDFHQDSWFGNRRYKTIRHHFSNLIHAKMSDRNLEDEYIEKFDSINIRTYFSIQHLLSVAVAIKQLRGLEKKLNSRYDEINFLSHRSVCISAIFSSVSFLEAAINELFMDAYDNHDGIVRDIPQDILTELSGMWELGVPRTASYNIIEKYQIALTIAKKDKINIGVQPAQNIVTLIRLRNSLVHYEPEWVTVDNSSNSNGVHKIEKALKNKFDTNPFTGENNPFFPDKCLSRGCVEWAFINIVSFCDYFFISMGIVPPYEKIRFKIGQILGEELI